MHESVISSREENEAARDGGYAGIYLYIDYELDNGGELNREYFLASDGLADTLDLLQELAVSPQRRTLASLHYYEKFPTLGNKRIDKIISFINNNYTRNLKLNEIAGMASMNSSAFCRYFKENTGKTLLQYVMEMRVGYACKLLALGEMDISQIAVECGFDSITHFNRTFKQLVNLTPTQYRSNIMK